MIKWYKEETMIEGETQSFSMTPWGPVKFPEARHNMWTAITNFDITEPSLWKISTIRGVDGIVPRSRYSFFVAIAPTFDEEYVKDVISKKIDPKKVDTRFEDVSMIASTIYDFWAVLKNQEGYLKVVSGHSQNELERNVDREVGWSVFRSGTKNPRTENSRFGGEMEEEEGRMD